RTVAAEAAASAFPATSTRTDGRHASTVDCARCGSRDPTTTSRPAAANLRARPLPCCPVPPRMATVPRLIATLLLTVVGPAFQAGRASRDQAEPLERGHQLARRVVRRRP